MVTIEKLKLLLPAYQRLAFLSAFFLFSHLGLSDLDDFEDEVLGGLEESTPAKESPTGKSPPEPSKLKNPPNSGSAANQPKPSVNKDIRKKPKDPSVSQPIDWSASTLKVSNADGTIELTSDVVVIQGGLKLNSNKAFIYFLPTREVDRIELLGDVKVVKVADAASDTRMSARSDKAFFNNRSQTVVLQGRASLNRVQDEVRGEIITYEINTGWITVKKVEGVVGTAARDEVPKPTENHQNDKKHPKKATSKPEINPSPKQASPTPKSVDKSKKKANKDPAPVEMIGGDSSPSNGAAP